MVRTSYPKECRVWLLSMVLALGLEHEIRSPEVGKRADVIGKDPICYIQHRVRVILPQRLPIQRNRQTCKQ